PFDDVAARDLEPLGQLCDFCENLFSLYQRLNAAGPQGLVLSEWGPFLNDLAEALLADEEDGAWDTGSVRAALFELTERFAAPESSKLEVDEADKAGMPLSHELRLGLSGMLHLLEQALDASRPST